MRNRCAVLALLSSTLTSPLARADGGPSEAPAVPAHVPGELPDRGRFGGLWVVPLATPWFQGAGLEAGYRYRWLVGLFREGFVQNGYAPAEATALARTRRVFFELELAAQTTFDEALTVAVGGARPFSTTTSKPACSTRPGGIRRPPSTIEFVPR